MFRPILDSLSEIVRSWKTHNFFEAELLTRYSNLVGTAAEIMLPASFPGPNVKIHRLLVVSEQSSGRMVSGQKRGDPYTNDVRFIVT